MALTILVGVAVASGAAALGARALLRRRQRHKQAKAKVADAGATSSVSSERAEGDAVHTELGVRPGDVVMVQDHELVTTGAWTFREGKELVAALYFADDQALLLSPRPDRRAFVLRSVRAPSSQELPASIEVDAQRFTRLARRPTRIERSVGAPQPPSDTPLLAEYEGEGASSSLWLIGRAGDWVAFCGEKVDPGLVDAWGPAT